MKRSLFAALAAVVCWCNPADATPQLRNLLAAVQATGTRVVVDHPNICKDPETFGMYQYRRNVIDQLTICYTNHNGDSAELRDTILHESVHVAQACKGGNLFTQHSIQQAALTDELMVVGKNYDREQFSQELEARVIARDRDEVFVTNLIKEHCK